MLRHFRPKHCHHRETPLTFQSLKKNAVLLFSKDVNITFPSFWCWSKAAMSSLAHWTLSLLGENSSCTAWTCPGWITCLPTEKHTHTKRKLTVLIITAGFQCLQMKPKKRRRRMCSKNNAFTCWYRSNIIRARLNQIKCLFSCELLHKDDRKRKAGWELGRTEAERQWERRSKRGLYKFQNDDSQEAERGQTMLCIMTDKTCLRSACSPAVKQKCH